MNREKARVCILGGPDERALAERLNAMSGGRAVNLAGEDTLETLPALLSHLDVFISGDTGPLHVAALAGTATIALFGPLTIVERRPEVFGTGPFIRISIAVHVSREHALSIIIIVCSR